MPRELKLRWAERKTRFNPTAPRRADEGER
jgi:hypothetical protein